ncbi:constitutive coactivator of PPAR-gamma-like protein 1 homolog [Dermacentor andersoni]|uniref:constitutive coactivator of PPAR-gamma-like protein 1 homolog n=1 Tax=Dermacentor andersoni TaxID=34620 RepID=UPI0021556063|nr:constitutive coactivator of PPAR-gamma-like protein 1 homolog [Dermacentor andersoni]
MGIQALQKFIEANCPGACVPVDLLKIARNAAVRRPGGRGNPRLPAAGNRLCLVVDGECCLDRLYGGYFSDWVCGGQWNRMVQFLSVLIQTIQNNNIELAVFFNGSLEPQRLEEWHRQQQAERRKVGQVLKHVATKATPPPKVWWIAPVCLRTCLRMALRHLNVTVLCSMDDHRQEVIAFCRENGFHGLMAEDAEYAIFDPPRYFSSAQLKLTYKGSLETREFILDEVARSLNLHPNRFCVLAALLGNYLLSEEDLTPFHRSLCPDAKGKAIPPETLIPAVVEFVRGLPSTEDLDALGARVFPGAPRDKVQRLKNCVHYYLNGTRDGFLRYRPSSQGRRHESGCYPSTSGSASGLPPISEQPAVNGKADVSSPSLDLSSPGEDGLQRSDPAKFASETAERELSSLTAYRQATGGGYPTAGVNGSVVNGAYKPGEPLDLSRKSTEDDSAAADANGIAQQNGPAHVNGGPLGPSSSSSNSSSPGRQSPKSWQGRKGQKGSAGASSTGSEAASASGSSTAAEGRVGGTFIMPEAPKLPKVPPEVMRTASERHQKGLMSPWIYQLLSQGAIKIPVAIEDEAPRDIPWGVTLFRPIRQMVYAVLFNMHHHAFVARQKREAAAASAGGEASKTNKENAFSEESKGPAPVVVVEWLGRSGGGKGASRRPYELVEGVQLGWPVPTVQRLWLGPSLDDKKCRLRAFLSCLRSDVPLMLNTAYVPQHLLIPCAVLRFLMSQGGPGGAPVLRRQELDAFLAQAVSPQLMDAQSTQGMQLPLVAVRGTQLASLFLQGVEHALFANDACGAPVPWLMCCPWLYFDGKLFHQKLLRAAQAKSLVEVCGGQIDQVAKVERMRAAILEGLQVEFARAPLPTMGGMPRFMPGYPPHGGPRVGGPMGMGPPPRGPAAGRGMPPPGPPRRGALLARGGQLEIAGVVVGSWGANYGQGPRGASAGPHRGGARGPPLPPQVTSVGGRYGMGRGMMPRRPMGLNRRPGAPFNQLNRRTSKKKASKTVTKEEPTPKLVGKGRGCTIETGENCTIEVSELAAKDLEASVAGSDENDCPAAATIAPTLLIAGATVTETDTDGPLSTNGAAAASEQFASV